MMLVVAKLLLCGAVQNKFTRHICNVIKTGLRLIRYVAKRLVILSLQHCIDHHFAPKVWHTSCEAPV